MDYKSVFTNLCLELQQNRSWIKGLCKNPQKSELIHWRQCLLSGGTEACSLGLRETPACIHVIQCLSQPRVACWQGFRQNSQKTDVRQAVEKKLCVYTASEAKGLRALRNIDVCSMRAFQPISCIIGQWSTLLCRQISTLNAAHSQIQRWHLL